MKKYKTITIRIKGLREVSKVRKEGKSFSLKKQHLQRLHDGKENGKLKVMKMPVYLSKSME